MHLVWLSHCHVHVVSLVLSTYHNAWKQFIHSDAKPFISWATQWFSACRLTARGSAVWSWSLGPFSSQMVCSDSHRIDTHYLLWALPGPKNMHVIMATAGLSRRVNSRSPYITPAQATANALTCTLFLSCLSYNLSVLDINPTPSDFWPWRHMTEIHWNQINLSSWTTLLVNSVVPLPKEHDKPVSSKLVVSVQPGGSYSSLRG